MNNLDEVFSKKVPMSNGHYYDEIYDVCDKCLVRTQGAWPCDCVPRPKFTKQQMDKALNEIALKLNLKWKVK